MTRSMTSCSFSSWSISSRLVTRPITSRPTAGATSAMASTISLCSSALERVASLPPCRWGAFEEMVQSAPVDGGADKCRC